MSKKNIFVFPCGSEIGLEIYSALQYSTYFHLIGGSSVEDHGKFLYEDYIGDLPFVDDPGLIPCLKKIIEERNIDAIYPTMDSVIYRIKMAEPELGCIVIAPPLETTEICLSKELTYQVLSDIIRTPNVYQLAEIQEYPVFVKPKVGYGGKGTALIRNQAELNAALSEQNNLMILEYLSGEEYTVDCFSDRSGKLRYFAARKRNRVKSGISVNTFFVENQEEFKPLIEKINKKLKFDGAWFAQFKRDKNGELCLLEIAARLGGASTLSRAVGVNLPSLSLFDAFGYNIEISVNDYKPVLDRALYNNIQCDIDYQTVYVDYDDCLILEKRKVNENLVSFLYKARNHDKKIVLLSKHNGNLIDDMKSFHVTDIFDEIIHIDTTEEKSTYISDLSSIFIDDSYSERERVKKLIGIHVFSPDMIDLL